MTILKALSAIALLSVAIAAPVSARDGRLDHLGTHWRHHHFRDAYNQRNERFDLNPQVQRNTDNFGGRDPSRIGGEDPDRHPSAY
jgi:hypothetical protein